MVEEVLLHERLIPDGARVVEKLREEGLAVAEAYWLYNADSDRWRLHLIVRNLGESSFGAYRRVVDAVRELRVATETSGARPRHFLIESDDIVVDGQDNPLARAVQHLREKRGADLPTRARRTSIEGERVDDMYLYRTDMRY